MCITKEEFQALVDECKELPESGEYLVDDYIDNLFLTVLDFQMREITINKAFDYYRENVRSEVKDHNSLKAVLSDYPNDKEGNSQVAQYLWENNHWKRIELLRRFVKYFEEQMITTQRKLKRWAEKADFEKDFKGKVHGADIAIFKWLVMRLGVETVKPDVWIHRFIEETIGRKLSNEKAVEVLEKVAEKIGMETHRLDWRIWEYMRS